MKYFPYYLLLEFDFSPSIDVLRTLQAINSYALNIYLFYFPYLLILLSSKEWWASLNFNASH